MSTLEPFQSNAVGGPTGYKHPMASLTLLRNDAEDAPISAVLNGVSGPSALALIGRFTTGSDRLRDSARLLADSEQESTASRLAEIVHLPSGRTANVIARARLRDAEILCGLGSVADHNASNIPCSKLYLHLEGNRFVLSTYDGETLSPRLASAHNVAGHQLPAYQFLSSLQHQDGIAGNIVDHPVINDLDYVPRIRYRSLILSPARWRLRSRDIQEITAHKSPYDRLNALIDVMSRRNISRFVTLVDGDNLLEADLRSDLSCLALIEELSGRTSAVIRESIGTLGPAKVSFGGSDFRHELFVPLTVSKSPSDQGTASLGAALTADYQKSRSTTLLPLQRWLYLELHCGEASGDQVIADVISPFIRSFANLIERWFFVRYYEGPSHHLRVRFLPGVGSDPNELLSLFRDAVKPQFDSALIHSLRVSSYEPEIDRYGGEEAMDVSEEIFTLSSTTIARSITGLIRASDKEDVRWLCGFSLLWQTLREAFLDLATRKAVAKDMSFAYRNELPASSNVLGAASANYRRDREKLKVLIGDQQGTTAVSPSAEETVKRVALIKKLRDVTTGQDFVRAITSIIHMDCNRLFPFHARANEMMLYEFRIQGTLDRRIRGILYSLHGVIQHRRHSSQGLGVSAIYLKEDMMERNFDFGRGAPNPLDVTENVMLELSPAEMNTIAGGGTSITTVSVTTVATESSAVCTTLIITL